MIKHMIKPTSKIKGHKVTSIIKDNMAYHQLPLRKRKIIMWTKKYICLGGEGVASVSMKYLKNYLTHKQLLFMLVIHAYGISVGKYDCIVNMISRSLKHKDMKHEIKNKAI